MKGETASGAALLGRGPRIQAGGTMRERVLHVVNTYLDTIRRNDASAVPLRPDMIGEFPTNTYRGAASFREALDPFARIVKRIDVLRLVVDGEHCVASSTSTPSTGLFRSPSTFMSCTMR